MIIAGGTTMIIGTILLASANSLAQLLVGRIVTGLGNGFNSEPQSFSDSPLQKFPKLIGLKALQFLPTRSKCVKLRTEGCS